MRDFLGMASGTDVVDWKFVEDRDVPRGPWARLGTNNNVARRYQQGASPVASAVPAGKPAKSRAAAAEMPTVINR